MLFDYGDTLVVPKKPDLVIVPTALNESFKVFEKNGLDIGYAKFAEYDGEVFGKYSKLEQDQKRDIPDGTKYDELASVVLPGLPAAERRKVAIEACSAFWAVFAESHMLRKGAKSSLMRLKKMGVRMGVVSNNHDADALRAHLKALGIFSYFSDITLSSELRYRKPDPRIFRRSAALLDVRPSEAVFVGDSPENDIVGAAGAGMRTILVINSRKETGPGKESSANPDYTIRDLREVPEIVVKLNRS